MQTLKCCKDCVAPKRHPGCHGTCLTYKAEKDEYDKRNKHIQKKKKEEDAFYAVLRKKF